jgi:hypothetical protein
MDNNHEQVHTRINQLNRDLMTAVKPLENFSVGRRAATQAIIGLTFLLVALGGFVLALVEFMRE